MTKSGNQYDFNLLRSLEVFLAVAEHGQITRAGTAMGITQSAVSQHLINLEELYSTSLIDRAQRPLQLTLSGEALRLHASNILQRVNSINADINQIDRSHIPLLRIGLLPSLATLLTPVLIEQAKNRYQVPTISLYADLSNAHEQMIKSRQVDLLVTSQSFYDLDGLARQSVLDEDFLLILPPDYENYDGDLERLTQQIPMVRFSNSVPAGVLVDRHLRRCNVTIEHFLDADRTTMIMAAVAAGQGFSILSPTLLLDGVIEGMSLKVLPLPIKPLQRSIILVNREAELDHLPLYLKQAITEKLQQAFEQLDPIAQQAVSFTA